ncbi:NADPH-dependent FMN reductase [Candidatus Cyanaurora vandensis]|uniref:NADPH-dependent FMN reductase n=1 Tax=Candidatus Cyanaurora vandensis TaxID=2714958 RepID=UPI00257B85B0|nr:NADPH-dependent FMN reductase [Candidatus Cyanaurora vandensis]
MVVFVPSRASRAVLLHALTLAPQGTMVEFFDPLAQPLPLCNGGDSYPDYPAVSLLKAKASAADVIISTPEYHGSFSGVLKNTLDLLSFTELEGKIFGAISVLGGGQNSNALNDLRIVARWVHAWVVPEQVAIGQAWKQFDNEGKLLDPKLEERLQELINSLILTAQRLRRTN